MKQQRLAPLFARTSAHLYRASIDHPHLYKRSIAAHREAVKAAA